MKNLRHAIVTGLIISILLFPNAIFAQDGSKMYNDKVKLTREMIKLERKELVGKLMNFTDQEAKAFWPIYDKYVSSMTFLNDQKFKLIADYREGFLKKNLSDKKAIQLLEEF